MGHVYNILQHIHKKEAKGFLASVRVPSMSNRTMFLFIILSNSKFMCYVVVVYYYYTTSEMECQVKDETFFKKMKKEKI
jgi:hypothetical protein